MQRNHLNSLLLLWDEQQMPEEKQLISCDAIPAFRKIYAQRFHSTADRQRSLLAASLAVKGLKQCGIPLTSWKIMKSGRPTLEGTEWDISLSHSESMVACLLGKGEVGVDVESWVRDDYGVMNRVTSKQEQQILAELEQDEACIWRTAFWTMKEAWLKRTGEGIRSMQQLKSMNFSAVYEQCGGVFPTAMYSIVWRDETHLRFGRGHSGCWTAIADHPIVIQKVHQITKCT